jgi:hypothetical protein
MNALELKDLLVRWNKALKEKWTDVAHKATGNCVSVPQIKGEVGPAQIMVTARGIEILLNGVGSTFPDLATAPDFPLDKLEEVLAFVRNFIDKASKEVDEAVARRVKALENEFKEMKTDIAEWTLTHDDPPPFRRK